MSLYSGANICKCSRIEPVVLVGKKKKKKEQNDFIGHFCIRKVGMELYNPGYSKLILH